MLLDRIRETLSVDYPHMDHWIDAVDTTKALIDSSKTPPIHPCLPVLQWIGLVNPNHNHYINHYYLLQSLKSLSIWDEIQNGLFMGYCLNILYDTLKTVHERVQSLPPDCPILSANSSSPVSIHAGMQEASLRTILEHMETNILPWCEDAFSLVHAWIEIYPNDMKILSYSEFYSVSRHLLYHDLYVISAVASLFKTIDPSKNIPKFMLVRWASDWYDTMHLELKDLSTWEKLDENLYLHPFLPHPSHIVLLDKH